jgi:hypothetical protein
MRGRMRARRMLLLVLVRARPVRVVRMGRRIVSAGTAVGMGRWRERVWWIA